MKRLCVATTGAGVVAAALLLLTSPLWMTPTPAYAQTAAPKPATNGYAGSEACTRCHREAAASFAETPHGKLFLKHPRAALERLGCEGCHGPGLAHGEAKGERLEGLRTFGKRSPLPMTEQNAVCLQCHEKTARLFWKGGAHDSRDVGCVNCHKVMTKVSERRQLAKATVIDTCTQCHLQRKAQLMRSSHMPLREGKMDCLSCHNPHGTVTPALLKENSVNDTCSRCHAEKRGPFLWEHPPVMESCANCHDPHGSNHEKMLKLARNRLCQSCHQEFHASFAITRAIPRQFTLGRQCLQCHSTIHGSNHPSGKAYKR